MPYGRDGGKHPTRTPSSGGDDDESCCKPGGCQLGDKIDANAMYDAVRVVCNNEHCTEGSFMHAACFDEFEQTIVNFLKGIGRARSWSDKQRRQNVWTKRGYDLAYKSCGCDCGKGYLKKDVDYQAPIREEMGTEGEGSDRGEASPPPSPGKSSRRRRKKANDKPALGRYSASPPTKAIGVSPPRRAQQQAVFLASSMSSSKTDDVDADDWMVATGGRRRVGGAASGKVGSFQRRKNLKSVQLMLPANKFNTMQVRVEEEATAAVACASDDLKPLVHETLASHHATTIDCYACARRMTVFDRYPLLDGTFFLSPRAGAAASSAASRSPRRQTYEFSNGHASLLHAVCVSCLVGRSEIACRTCARQWDGSYHQVGGVYSYDIFAASPCCDVRLACSGCRHLVVDSPATLQYFSDFSHQHQCPNCQLSDFHFVKPFDEVFTVRLAP